MSSRTPSVKRPDTTDELAAASAGTAPTLTANTLELAPRASSADDFAGRTLGEFVLHDPIGRGGFGTVYRATQPALDREAVVKVLHPHLVDTSSAADRFLREARLASKLDHPYADPQPCARGSPSG